MVAMCCLSWVCPFQPGALAQAPENGEPFQINSYTTGAQHSADIAMTHDGGFVVVWAGNASGGDDSSDRSIHVRRFDVYGNPLGNEGQVNQFTTGRQANPRVAAGSDGGFVVVWWSYEPVPPDNDSSSIQGRWYDASGLPAGDEVQINTYSTGWQAWPDVGVDSDGTATVVWSSLGSSGTDSSLTSVLGRRFDSNGNPMGAEFQVNTYTTGRQQRAVVDVASSGQFVVAWENGNRLPPGEEVTDVRARRFAPNGDPIASDFQVNSYTGYYHLNPAVGIHDDGSFLVAWPSWGSLGDDQGESSIQARRYQADGQPAASQVQVNSFTTGQQLWPKVAIDPSGRAIVAWQTSDFYDTTTTHVALRRFEPSGIAESADFAAYLDPSSGNSAPALDTDSDGNIAVTWQSLSPTIGTDTDAGAVFGRRFDALFRDGFESGSSARWSSSNP
jgi:hypothetical protein